LQVTSYREGKYYYPLQPETCNRFN